MGIAQAKVAYLSGHPEAADTSLAALFPRIAAQMPRINAQRALCDALELRATIASQQGKPQRARELLLQLQATAQAKSGLHAPSSCGDEAAQGLNALRRSGRYIWKSA